MDAFLAASYFLLVLSLQPRMVDGDGLSHASRAVYGGFLEGMIPKHLMVASVFRAVYLVLSLLGLERWTFQCLAGLDHLAIVGVYLLLARSLFPRFLRDSIVVRVCALGAVGSFGVMACACTVEVYALALLAGVALMTYAFAADLSRMRSAAIVAALLVAAIGMHVANVLTVPLLFVLAAHRLGLARGSLFLVKVGVLCVAGGAVLVALMLIGKGVPLWPPDPVRILPQADPEPAQRFVMRLARAAYGFARTVAFLPPIRTLSGRLAVPYAIAALAMGALTFILAWGSLRRAGSGIGFPVMALAALVVPFVVLGVLYYPSDPERWLFLMPALWLVIGLVWDRYELEAPALLDRRSAVGLLGAFVLGLIAYNATVGLLPPATSNRQLAGLQKLVALTRPGDLVISPGGIGGRILQFYLGEKPPYRNVALIDLANAHPDDERGLRDELDALVRKELQSGGRVFVYDLFDEGHRTGEGYPWSFISQYRPDDFVEVLTCFRPVRIVAPGGESVGIYALGGERADRLER